MDKYRLFSSVLDGKTAKVVKTVCRSSVKLPVSLLDCNQTLIFPTDLNKTPKIKCYKTPSTGG